MLALADELAAHIDIGVWHPWRRRPTAAFDQKMGIVTEDFAVLAGAGFDRRVDDEIMGPVAHHLGHEGPLEARRDPAPPRPPGPDAFISFTIQSGPCR